MIARIHKSMNEKDKDKGFTLIELLVVIIIIGILAAIAIPVFMNQRKKAVDTGIKSDIRTIANEMETAYVDLQVYPAATDNGKTVDVTGGPKIQTSEADTVYTVNVATDLNSYTITGVNTKKGTGVTFNYDSSLGGMQAPTAAKP